MRPTATLLVSNMHCPSCVETITSLLRSLPHLIDVHISLLLHTVTFGIDGTVVGSTSTSQRPYPEIIGAVMELLSNQGGFIIDEAEWQGGRLDWQKGYTGRWLMGREDIAKGSVSKEEETRRRTHLEHCQACREGDVKHEKQGLFHHNNINAEGMVLERLRETTILIEGMTCSSCSSTITSTLQDHKGIKHVAVDLLGNKGVVHHSDLVAPHEIKTMVEDCGYDVEIVTSMPIGGTQIGGIDPNERMVRIRVEGVYCENCIVKLNTFLDSLPVTYSAFTLSNPSTSITYRPHCPLSIRDILAGLGDLAPEFDAKVVRSISLSDRSRDIQKKEMRILGIHWLVAFVFAIPTFIIAIVGMVLLPEQHDFRMMWMKPVWGGANLGTIVLWPLATVVQFGVGRLFYDRALGPIRPLFEQFLSPSTRTRTRGLSWRSFFTFGSMDLLVVLSTTVSYFASLAMLIIDIHSSHLESVGTYFDSCVFLIMFILLGRVLESFAKSKTTDAVSLLGRLRPDYALLVENRCTPGKMNESLQKRQDDMQQAREWTETSTRTVPVEHLEIGDFILLQPGSFPPTDGIITSGTTTFDESSLTGESLPITKQPGDEIFTGTTNLSSAITIRVTRLESDTVLEKIMSAVSSATIRKAPLEKLAEKLTGVFVPIIVYLSLIVLIVWVSLATSGCLDEQVGSNGGGKIFFAIEFAIATLVVACPCGIGLAVPCANAVGTGLVAKAGVLASGGGEAFVAATKVDIVILDKTGTLTEGKSTVTDEACWDREGMDEEEMKGVVRELENTSTHPLARGLAEYLEGRQVSVEVVKSEEIPGRGLRATIKDQHGVYDILLGNTALILDHGTQPSNDQRALLENWSENAKSTILVAIRRSATHSVSTYPPSGKAYLLRGAFALSDPPRPSSLRALNALRARGVSTTMLSGDNPNTAQAVGKLVGISPENVRGGVGPQGKADVIRELQEMIPTREKSRWRERWETTCKTLGVKVPRSEPNRVMFVGDGINDSVALAAADVSVAMGHGSQATLAGADFILLSSSLSSLPTLLTLSRKIVTRQKLNFSWAIVFNVVCLPFAMGVFYPAGGIRLTPVWSALLMALSSVSVVVSSLALRWGI